MLIRMLFSLFAIIVSIQPAVQQRTPLDRMSFMVGRWTGEGTGTPGESVGEFSFEWDLRQNVLIRRSFAAYPATKDRSASRHDDLMVVFIEGERLKAEYFDTEGHVIHYAVSLAADGNSIEFLSEAISSAPRYRLTYTKTRDANLMKLRFEIANPDKRDLFTAYIDASLHRVH